MPKEQACSSGEHSLCASSSKNAKDKSNSSTLLAMRNTKDADESSGRGSCCSSEKDSGYSDGSDWQQTDVEDQQSNKNQSRGCERAETSGKSQDLVQGNPGNPPLMASGHQLSPIYIINNMGLKQPDSIPKRGQLLHKNGSRESGGSGAAHMILYQQPSLLLATLQLQPPSLKSAATGKKKNGTYLPILNSYPRIAPHPSKKPPDKSPPSDDSQNLSKRVCTEHQSDDSPVTLPDQHLNKQPKLAVSSSELPTRDNASPSSSSAVSSSSTSGSSLVSNRGTHRSGGGGGGGNTRHRRFLNTVEILRQSGLLDITLRTKELLRQSNATERDIAQLRQHTELLCQVANRPNGTAAWEHLHRSMAESSSYPDLKTLPTPSHRPGSDSGAESVSTGNTENSDAPLSRFLTTDPKPSCPVSLTRSAKVTFMPPDSSTG